MNIQSFVTRYSLEGSTEYYVQDFILRDMQACNGLLDSSTDILPSLQSMSHEP